MHGFTFCCGLEINRNPLSVGNVIFAHGAVFSLCAPNFCVRQRTASALFASCLHEINNVRTKVRDAAKGPAAVLRPLIDTRTAMELLRRIDHSNNKAVSHRCVDAARLSSFAVFEDHQIRPIHVPPLIASSAKGPKLQRHQGRLVAIISVQSNETITCAHCRRGSTDSPRNRLIRRPVSAAPVFAFPASLLTQPRWENTVVCTLANALVPLALLRHQGLQHFRYPSLNHSQNFGHLLH
mmetsp:Transcript_30547/g.91272  ORF Transcript_30547/g.91272 Transcript_30547/m.91272 type:complete len:238 (-) Transcript_30547:903-1616(-)